MSTYDVTPELEVEADGPIRVIRLPRQAVEDTLRILNLHMERAVVATLDFALAAEDRSFTSSDLRASLDSVLSPAEEEKQAPAGEKEEA